MTLRNGDNTRAFGGNFITMFIDNPAQIPVSKVIFSVGCIVKTYENPQFPLYINFNSKETEAFRAFGTRRQAFSARLFHMACS